LKVAFLIRSLTYGGAERQLILTAAALTARGVDVVLLVYYPGPLDDEARRLGLRVIHVERSGRWDVIGFSRKLLAAIDAEAPDVLYSFLPVANLFAAVVKLLRPRLALVWGIRASALELSRYPLAVRVSLQCERMLRWLPQAVIANSQAGLDNLKLRPHGPNVVIPNAVDPTVFYPAPDSRTATRARLGIADSHELIGMIARLDPMKDHTTFLRAAALIRMKRPNARFVCAGRGDMGDHDGLRALAVEAGIGDLIILDGHADLVGLYNAMDLLVLSSAYGESMPNVVLEAMACGTPAVVTDVGAAPQAVENPDRVVPPRDPEALARACITCLDEVASDPSAERLRARVIERFSVDRLAESTLAVLRKVSSPRVTVVVGSLKLGGCERHLSIVLPALHRRGFDIVVYTLTERGALADTIEAQGVQVIGALGRDRRYMSLPRLVRGGLVMVNLILHILRHRPAIVHCFLPEACIVGGAAARLSGFKNVVMSRRSLRDYQKQSPVMTRLEHMLLRRARAVLGNSRAVVNQLREERAPESRLGLLYSGVDLPPLTASPEALRRHEGIGADALVLGILANLHPYKGHLTLLEALASIAEALPTGWTLLCIGEDAGCRAALEAKTKELRLDGNVRFLGGRPEAVQYWQIVDVGLLVSTQEGFSMALLEGMAAAVPMIVTDVGGNSEAVIDGACGQIVPSGDAAALAQAILRYVHSQDLRRQHGEAAASRVRETFSLESCVSRYASLYGGLLTSDSLPVQTLIDRETAL
jgi:glycosyltransferase involved in cell wall biosynthesis